MTLFRRTAPALLLPLLLSACALSRPPATVAAPAPAAWHAPLPHGGTVEGLERWWQRLDDPLLVELIAAAQEASPTLAQARSRLLQARATTATARAAQLPTADASASAQRGVNVSLGGIATTLQGGVQASWDADLFGALAANRDAADARLAGARASWHEARVAVAADVANQLDTLRNCRRLLAVARSDAASRAETARLAGLAADAGFQAPADAALARASAADADARSTQQRAACDVSLKGLVALTALDETVLEQKVASAQAAPGLLALFSIATLPAQVLEQRPDVYNAARELAAASAEVASADAQRYPQLSLQGTVGRARSESQGQTLSFNSWTVGPVSVALPLFDGGRRRAAVDAAQARYDEAAAVYRGKARQAVREVEEALVNLQAAADRTASAEAAADGYRLSFEAMQARYRSGLASLLELEDSRRTALASETARVNLERERMAAWVALYRAAGGGWDASQPAPGDAVSAAPATTTSR
ncbi:efflux transporter outer membrane subunit [Xylophilus sp. GW821-FHT01B05]